MKTVLITDLDNTLFDWFEAWYGQFSTLLDGIEKISGIGRDKLIPEIKKVHQKHGTAEYEFLIQEISLIKDKHSDLDSQGILDFYGDAIESSRKRQESLLALYPTVLDTLNFLKSKGVVIVGYTESQSFYACSKIKKLGLDGILDFLYAAPSHDFPKEINSNFMERYGLFQGKLDNTTVKYTLKGAVKPNADILLEIISQVGALPEQCVYIGDSLSKDIFMAHKANVSDVYAEYGVSHKKEEYELLRLVTHWTDKQVQDEKRSTPKSVRPTYSIGLFSDILNIFDFYDHEEIKKKALPHVLEIWKATVDVQKHFNELCLKTRQLAVTVLVAYIGALGYLSLRADYSFAETNAGIFFMLAVMATIAWLVFFLHDRYGYHGLLKGAVLHGVKIENAFIKEFPVIGLSKSIGIGSKFNFGGKVRDSNWRVGCFYVLGFIIIWLPFLFFSLFRYFSCLNV